MGSVCIFLVLVLLEFTVFINEGMCGAQLYLTGFVGMYQHGCE